VFEAWLKMRVAALQCVTRTGIEEACVAYATSHRQNVKCCDVSFFCHASCRRKREIRKIFKSSMSTNESKGSLENSFCSDKLCLLTFGLWGL
jgi:hypothetical protein